AKLGYDIIEIPMLDPDALDVSMTVRLLEEYGLGVTLSLGLSAGEDFSSGTPDTRDIGDAKLRQVVSMGAELGATHVTGILYSALQKYDRPATARGVEQSVEVLRGVCEAAEANNIVVGLEVVNRYETNIANTAAQGVELCKMIGAPNVKVHLDTYHMNIEEDDAERAIMETGDYLGYFHVGESHRGYLGSGSIDFDSIFRGLVNAGYSGPITFESFSSKVVNEQLSNTLGIWRNLWTDSSDLCQHARDFMRAHLRSAAAIDSFTVPLAESFD
ncbi:MAG: sugar phosphate isomerase/epimerase family protein, partial [Acidimicrobiales bacterium]